MPVRWTSARCSPRPASARKPPGIVPSKKNVRMNDLSRDESVGRLLERALRPRVTAGSLEDCPDAETLAAWSDGTLTAGEQASVEAHAADCARCQAHLAAMARMPVDIPESALHNPQSTIQSAIPNPQSAIRAAARWFVPALAAAAALVAWVWVPSTRRPAAPQETPRLEARAEPARPLPSSAPAAPLPAAPPPAVRSRASAPVAPPPRLDVAQEEKR